MSDFTPARVSLGPDHTANDQVPIPVVSKLSPAEIAMLGIADQVSAALKLLAAILPAAAGLVRNAAAIDVAVAEIRALDK